MENDTVSIKESGGKAIKTCLRNKIERYYLFPVVKRVSHLPAIIMSEFQHFLDC